MSKGEVWEIIYDEMAESHWQPRCFVESFTERATLRVVDAMRKRCIAELAVCRWLAPTADDWKDARTLGFERALDEVETPWARLIDEDPLPEDWSIGWNGDYWELHDGDGWYYADSFRAAVRLAWALEQGLELDHGSD